MDPKGVYVTNRGVRWYIAHMDSSHLINAIGFHRKQLETLRSLIADFKNNKKLVKRAQQLATKTHELEQELAKRDPDDDHIAERDNYTVRYE